MRFDHRGLRWEAVERLESDDSQILGDFQGEYLG